ncbi:DUF6896 domain-containing protein [Hymenobacter chitinivorans]|uniref:DUF6896 domain-containing protein n=1 Tax=Hymenobacter chitinivorans DSM 11115 TaxID=1121954 RepID=A0A2M9BQ17_9BACT|nr:hypothetical protein [Hymenobacter chitinivorans]PJJ60044.1 hypothetical protein CLV45_1469 [Hymenobacter chitinivorans DSM 11115]
MQERYVIPDPKPLPSAAELLELLQEYREVGFRYTFLPDGYLDRLFETLENHAFRNWDAESGGFITIIPAVSTPSILARKAALYACAKEFRRQAFELMDGLYEALSIPPEKRDDWKGLMRTKMLHIRRGQSSGVLKAGWSYYLHGYECLFRNNRTGQEIDVILINCPEFGCLDPWFFLQYINTTKEFIELREWLGNEHENAKKVLTVLAKAGMLSQLSSARDDRPLFAP